MSAIIAWFKSLFGKISPAKIPRVEMRRIVNNELAKDWKTSSITIAKCGLLVGTYHNITRTDAAIDLVNPSTGASKNLIRNNNETFGKPTLIGGWWYFTAENRVSRVVRIRDADGKAETTNRVQPEDYSTVASGEWFPISWAARKPESSRPPRLWSCVTGNSGYQFKKLRGIASGICKWGGKVVISVGDGSEAGVESESGDWITDDSAKMRENWSTPTINTVNGSLIAFRKNGTVVEIKSLKDKEVKVIGNIGLKPCRSVSTGNLIFWTTSNKDSLCVTNGDKVARIWDMPGSDLSDGTSSGSLFDTDVDVRGSQIVIARSQQNGGFEVWVGSIK